MVAARRRPRRPRPFRRPERRLMRGAAPIAVAAALLLAAAAPQCAPAAEAPPPGAISSERARNVADRDPRVVAERAEHPGLTSRANFVDGNWEVAYFAGDQELVLVLVEPVSGAVRESWTGY